MGWWLAQTRSVQASGTVSRFDPRFWTVDFPRPMMAAATTPAPDGLRVDLVFYKGDDLAGLIWESADRLDHPLLAYDTARDYRGCRLAFHWRSAGVRPLDAVNGPVLTIEGRDANGAARSWYVRLWNYATGTPEDAAITLDFAQMDGGFLLPGEADPVWAGDVDRMFVSLVPAAYDGTAAPLATAAEAWIELSGIVCDGPGAVLGIGEVVVPEHGLRLASGYDDSYNVTPARLLRNALQLGYRGPLVHYVGMSHAMRLAASGSAFLATTQGGALNVAAAAWHRDFAARAQALGFAPIWSTSYELLDQHCPDAWKQRAWNGDPALTGWVPPSTLLSPANAEAMAYVQALASAFVAIGTAAGLAPEVQVGEPWWWVLPDGRPCLYDAAARAALGNPIEIASVRGALDAGQTALLDAAGALLAQSTAALVAAVRAIAPDVETHLLAYLPTVLDPAAPEIRRANLPLGWAKPAFDWLQLEDYDWVTAGDTARTTAGVAEAGARLGYAAAEQDYFAGFVADPARAAADWARIDAAADAARSRGTAHVFVWALPEILRDGFVHFDLGDTAMQAFDDVPFPLALGSEAEVTPGFSTAIVTSAGGHEARNASWAQARTRYDVGPGIRSANDIATLLAFYRARLGPARGFRLRDPFDASSGGALPSPLDQTIGSGDGTTTRFALAKSYGDHMRRITRPVAGTVRVAVGGVETAGFTLEEGGWVTLDVAPPAGTAVSAGFLFDVPVRFADDTLSVTRATFLAGQAAHVPLIELREDL